MIKLNAVSDVDIVTIKKNFDTLGKKSFQLFKPEGDNVFLTVKPTTSDLSEGESCFWIDDLGGVGEKTYIAFCVNNTIKQVQIT